MFISDLSRYLYFQYHAGRPVRDFIVNGGNEKKILVELNNLFVHPPVQSNIINARKELKL
jgi:hypothetical protein